MEWLIKYGGVENMELYDCRRNNRTRDDWYDTGHKQPVLGTLFLAYGIIIELMYVPCLLVISRPVFQRMSCYKIMFLLGVLDMMAITVNSIITGHLMIHGGVYCTNPTLIYIAGSFGLGLWCAACLSCLVLVCNRIIELWKPHLMDFLFEGYRTWIVMMLPVCYGLYFILFTPPVLFTSIYDGWFFDTFIFVGREAEYMNNPHTLNNLGLVLVTCSLYTLFCGLIVTKFRNVELNQRMTWMQKSIFLQATSICIANLVGALIYVYMQFFPTPALLVVLGHMAWQISHGLPAMVYLSLNSTVQREVLKMFGIKYYKNFRSIKSALGVTKTKPTGNSVGPTGDISQSETAQVADA